jgi:NADPH:quinone reductase-like Zn-dependent oxidoreductase
VRIPFPDDAPGFVRKLAGFMEGGQFHGVFDRRYPFAEIIDAFRYVEAGQKTGIVVIDIR